MLLLENLLCIIMCLLLLFFIILSLLLFCFFIIIILLFLFLYYDFMISIYIIILCFTYYLFSYSCALFHYIIRGTEYFYRWTQQVVFVQRSSLPNPLPPCPFFFLTFILKTQKLSYLRSHFFSSLNLSFSYLFILLWLPCHLFTSGLVQNSNTDHHQQI